MTYSLGIDPDSHHTAFAVCSPERIEAVKVVETSSKFKGQEAIAQQIMAIATVIPVWLSHLISSRRISDYPQVIVAEGQQIYQGGKTPNWKSVVMLGPITGAAAAAVRVSCLATVKVPLPHEWRGDIPKHVVQARILNRRNIPYRVLGLRDRYAIPDCPGGVIYGSDSMTATGWKHAVDAIGLADWGLKETK